MTVRACTTCGGAHHEWEICPGLPPPTGWRCPACGKGNAPHADRCGHCADVPVTGYTPPRPTTSNVNWPLQVTSSAPENT